MPKLAKQHILGHCCLVVLRHDEVLRGHESLSMATKTMFCERENVEVLNINQQNDKSTQEYLY